MIKFQVWVLDNTFDTKEEAVEYIEAQLLDESTSIKEVETK